MSEKSSRTQAKNEEKLYAVMLVIVKLIKTDFLECTHVCAHTYTEAHMHKYTFVYVFL